MKVEILQNPVFILLIVLGSNFYCGVLLTIVSFHHGKTYGSAVGMLIYCVAVLRGLEKVAVVFAGGGNRGGVGPVGEHDGDVNGGGFDLLDRVEIKFSYSSDGKEGEEEEDYQCQFLHMAKYEWRSRCVGFTIAWLMD